MNISKIANLKFFYTKTEKIISFLSILTLFLFIAGIYWGLFVAPEDYLQGNSYRIMYIHVPAAWLSLQTYIFMAIAGFIALVWKIKIMEIASVQSASIGAFFTIIALVTGMIWGKPTWGTYWVWDARLTSELILLFLYIGVIVLYASFSDKRQAVKITSLLAIIGLINIPIIHYSVEWWNTLHQPASINIFTKSSIHTSMLFPLLIMTAAFALFSLLIFLMKYNTELIKIKNKGLDRL